MCVHEPASLTWNYGTRILPSQQVAGCTSIGPECAATSPPPTRRPASPRASALKRSMSMLGPATSWRGAGGAAGPAQDVRHQPPGTTINIYCNYCHNHNLAAGLVVKAADKYAEDSEFEPRHKQLFIFIFYVHRHMNLYIQCMYLICTWAEQVCTRTCM